MQTCSLQQLHHIVLSSTERYTETPLINDTWQLVLNDRNFYYGIILVPLFWLFLYAMTGAYHKVYRKARMRTSIPAHHPDWGYHYLLLPDSGRYDHQLREYYKSFLTLFSLHFFLTFILRYTITSITLYKLQSQENRIQNTSVVGSNGNAVSIYNEIENQPLSSGNQFMRFRSSIEYPATNLNSSSRITGITAISAS